MIVGTGRVTLMLHGVASLKEKRGIVKKIIERTKNRFNMSVSETSLNDVWQRCEIGMSVVGNDAALVNSQLDKAVNFIESMHIAEIIDVEIEVISH